MYPPIEELLTHRGNMLLIDHVLSFDQAGIRVAATVDGDAWYANAQGAMPAWIGIELMAQAIAALVGLAAHTKNLPPKQGLLLGTRNFTAQLPAFAQNKTLIIAAREIFQEENGLGAFDASIELDGNTVAVATLNRPPGIAPKTP
jgi:predicted hotdog family 3-hydroxylacyl-ACP dehydratase